MLCITVRLRLGAYDAASVDDPLSPEWPPHPARVFCALVAGAPTDAEWAALRWLESQPPPEVHAPPAADRQAPEQYLVTNATEAGGGSQEHPGRKQTVRVKARLLPAGNRFHVVWPDAAPSIEHGACLAALARRVPYVGRATADAEVLVADHIDGGALEVYEPVSLRDAEVGLRVPYTGYSDRLAAAFGDGRRAWEESRRAGYRRRWPGSVREVEEVTPSPFETLVVLAVQGRSHLGSSHTARATDVLRRATMARVDAELGAVPDPVSGHADGEHVAYLALPNVGTPPSLPGAGRQRFVARNPHADGRLLGFALAIPHDGVDAADLHRCLLGLTPRAELDLTLGANGVVSLCAASDRSDLHGLTPSRWTAASRWWATATPLVLDRFTRPGRDDVAGLVADAIATAGYPRPVEVGVSRSGFLPGAAVLGRSAVQRRAGLPVRPWCHAWARFDVAVAGPLVAGSMRYRGLGLFAPLVPSSEGDEALP